MRVVLVTHYFPSHGGGIEVVAGQLAQRLAAHGMQILWHASGCDPSPDGPRLRCSPATAFNFLEKRFGVPYPLWSLGSLARLARDVRSADLVHLHDCLYFANVVAFLAARFSGRPVVVTQHIGMVPYRSAALRGLLAAANRLLGRLVLGGACQALFVAEPVRRYFEGFVRFRRPALVVANGVDHETFRPASPDERRRLREALGVRPDQLLLLFVGRFVEKKGLALVRELASRLPDALWILAGGGPLQPEGWSAPNVRVLRSVQQLQLVPLYQAADLLVLPSVGEGFPLVVQEAMACGTPSLVDVETSRAHPQLGDLLPAEPVSGEHAAKRWARRIRAITMPGEPASALRGRVARFAAEHWSWEVCARRHAEAMRACVSVGGKR